MITPLAIRSGLLPVWPRRGVTIERPIPNGFPVRPADAMDRIASGLDAVFTAWQLGDGGLADRLPARGDGLRPFRSAVDAARSARGRVGRDQARQLKGCVSIQM
jgi:hypothetical protein